MMEHQMEKQMEHEMEAGFKFYLGSINGSK